MILHMSCLKITISRCYLLNRHVFLIYQINKPILQNNGSSKPIRILEFRIPAGSIVFQITPEPYFYYTTLYPIKPEIKCPVFLQFFFRNMRIMETARCPFQILNIFLCFNFGCVIIHIPGIHSTAFFQDFFRSFLCVKKGIEQGSVKKIHASFPLLIYDPIGCI